jgi:glycine cleavage system protein P-like pyridoxal-binding family
MRLPEMLPITWPEFSNIHPFALLLQAAGYKVLFDQLQEWLAEITGFDSVSLQPNAGSQGNSQGFWSSANITTAEARAITNIVSSRSRHTEQRILPARSCPD